MKIKISFLDKIAILIFVVLMAMAMLFYGVKKVNTASEPTINVVDTNTSIFN
jgi:hypothetical protein